MHADSIRLHTGAQIAKKPAPRRYRSPLAALLQVVFLCGLVSLPVAALLLGLRGAWGLP